MKKRICFYIESMVVGGAERVLLNLVNNLPNQKYDITVCSVFKESVYSHYKCQFIDQLKPYIHYRYLIDNTNTFIYRAFNFAFNRGCKSILHKLFIGNSYDIEVAWYEGMPTEFVAHSSNKHSKKLAWLHYGDGFKNLNVTQKNMYHNTYSQFHTIVGVSDGVTNNFKSRIGTHFNAVTRYNIVEDDTIRTKSCEPIYIPKESGKITFVSVGRLCPIKGFDRLIKACSRLKEEGEQFQLWLIGDGDKQTLQYLITKHHLQDNVILWGNQDNPFPYVKAADWFICSSYAEGFSTAMTESLILGTPIISTTYPSAIEMLGDNKYGILVENSELGLYEGMKKVLNDSKLMCYYTSAAIQKSHQFQKIHLLEELEKIFCL